MKSKWIGCIGLAALAWLAFPAFAADRVVVAEDFTSVT